MIFRQYRIRLGLYVCILTLIIGLFFYCLFYWKSILINAFLLFTFLIVFFKMIKYVDRINSELTKLFDSIHYSDFSLSIPQNVKGDGFEELYQSLRFVIEKFREERKQRVEHYNYMKTIVQHVRVGLIAFNAAGKIELMNLAFKKLFGVRNYKSLRQLGNNVPELLKVLENIHTFKKDNVQIKVNGEQKYLAVSATEFILHQQKYKLVSVHDINSELEKKEMEAWEKLIRVITHEIMNSITPIASLAATANLTLEEANSEKLKLTDEDVRDIALAVKTIEKRSQGLLKFVEKYRQVTTIPKPELAMVKVQKIFQEILPFIEDYKQLKNIEFHWSIFPENLEIRADAVLVEQVMINLIKNAMDSLQTTQNPRLELIGKISSDSKVQIEIIDNGEGISEDNLQKIFVPFFTTKKEGSGIGLSLSRQIMRAHNGRLVVHSLANKQTVFTMEF
ncbi:MAG: ATP-binding protein [Candidatus Marinimicrobia bacterium]|nr:ATP-binding protein [Candidatus Neomarinimicrobiota bacterium]